MLGLVACHLRSSRRDMRKSTEADALSHRVAALRVLGSLLAREEVHGLKADEEEAVLAIILLLIFHDVRQPPAALHPSLPSFRRPWDAETCRLDLRDGSIHPRNPLERGDVPMREDCVWLELVGSIRLDSVLLGGTSMVSTEGTYFPSTPGTPISCSLLDCQSLILTKPLLLCRRLDVLRGFSGAEKLTYSESVRRCVLENGQVSLHTLVGCPPSIFQRIGTVLEAAKNWLAGNMANGDFHATLRDADTYLRELDLDETEYPTQHPEWRQLAEAYRHACLLRVMRWPDTFAVPCEDAQIKASVAAILDARANIAASSPFSKRMLFPLFLAAADTTVPHQLHYAAISINEIRRSTGFEHPAMKTVLEHVWEERRSNTRGWRNVPWMEFVSISSSSRPCPRFFVHSFSPIYPFIHSSIGFSDGDN